MSTEPMNTYIVHVHEHMMRICSKQTLMMFIEYHFYFAHIIAFDVIISSISKSFIVQNGRSEAKMKALPVFVFYIFLFTLSLARAKLDKTKVNAVNNKIIA